jgi:hypothetical protein
MEDKTKKPKEPKRFDPKKARKNNPSLEREMAPVKGKKKALWGFPFMRRGRILPNPPGAEGQGNPGGQN